MRVPCTFARWVEAGFFTEKSHRSADGGGIVGRRGGFVSQRKEQM